VDGCQPLLPGQPRTATVVAQERTVALVIDRDTLLDLRSTVPTLEAGAYTCPLPSST